MTPRTLGGCIGLLKLFSETKRINNDKMAACLHITKSVIFLRPVSFRVPDGMLICAIEIHLIRERFEIQLSIKISEYKRRFELILSSLSSE